MQPLSTGGVVTLEKFCLQFLFRMLVLISTVMWKTETWASCKRQKISGDCAASAQSCHSGNAAYSQLISTTVKMNKNKYFHNKCVANSSKLDTSQTAGTKQSSPAILQIVTNSAWPEEQIRNGCPSGQSNQLTIADKSLLAITLSYQIHLEMQWRCHPPPNQATEFLSEIHSPI